MNQFSNKLSKLTDEIKKCPKPLSLLDHESRKKYFKIEAIISIFSEYPNWNGFLNSVDNELRATLMEINLDIHRNSELELAERYIASNVNNDPISGSWYSLGFRIMLEEQIDRWKKIDGFVKRVQNIALIGGGALPQTHIFLRDKLRKNIYTIDLDKKASNCCLEILKRLGIYHNNVINDRGEELSYDRFDLVVIAALVYEKSKILKRLHKQGYSGFICIRRPYRLHRIWRNDVDESLLRSLNCEIVDICDPKPSSIYSQTIRFKF